MTKTMTENLDEFGLPIEEEVMFEMANLGPNMHKFGVTVKLNLPQPGDKKYPHGPRIKVFHGTAEYFIRLNHDPSKMIIEGDVFLNNREAKIVYDLVVKFREPFLTFWHDSKMTTDELRDLMKEIDPERFKDDNK